MLLRVRQKAEYIVASLGAREAIWLRKLIVGLFGQPMEPIVIYCDNQSCTKLAINPLFHNRSKHIEIPNHYLRDMVERKVIQLEYVCIDQQTVDILTKPLARNKIEHFMNKLSMVKK